MREQYGRDDNLELSRLDSLGDSDRLRADARRELTEAGERFVPPAHHEGADPSDSVWVTVDSDGRVESVDISRHWLDRLDAEGFPSALHAAYTSAVRKLVNASVLATLAAQEEIGRHPFAPPNPPAGRPTPTPEPPAPGPVDERDWLSQTWQAIEDIDEQLRRLDQISTDIEFRESREKILTSPEGHLTARINGGGVTTITGDPQSIRNASTEQLRLAALALFRAAAEATEN
ncbi:hypothetical protein ABNF97_07235 [Plantactinospora sp. B6F1]|uniref:hypothetical protein n=1 Tax=Plantactinospora sp. B6F1 TaxID=3158971 RepID=UPI00102C0D3E